MGPDKGCRRRSNLFVDAVQQLWDCRGTHQDPTYTKIYVAFLAMTGTDEAISLSVPFNNYGIASERIKTRLTPRFM